MSTQVTVPDKSFEKEAAKRGADTAWRCYQCATCSSVCQLAPPGSPFPRRQMLLAQWGQADRLASDPAVWLCHQCNDCTVRCPRDARPGDVMQSLRSMAVERLAVPAWLGRLVGGARWSWPLLFVLPLLFWIAVLYALGSLPDVPRVPIGQLIYEEVVPHWLIYLVYIPVAGLVVLAAAASAWRFWNSLEGAKDRRGSFILAAIGALWEIATHKRFAKCEAAAPRRWGHFWLMWGFAGALVATTLAIVALYLMHDYPLPLDHPFKWVGNAAAAMLLVGGVLILGHRLKEGGQAGKSTAYDNFFLATVLLVVVTGVLSELGRFAFRPGLAVGIYVVHLGSILTLFATFPYSKFIHFVYRTLALIHEKMMQRKSAG